MEFDFANIVANVRNLYENMAASVFTIFCRKSNWLAFFARDAACYVSCVCSASR